MESTECIRTITPCNGIRTLESEKIFLVESGLLGFGIGNTAQEPRRNPSNFWNQESKFRWQRLESIDMTSNELDLDINE